MGEQSKQARQASGVHDRRALRSARRARWRKVFLLGAIFLSATLLKSSLALRAAAPAPQGFFALDFADPACAQPLENKLWQYDADWSRRYPEFATYRNGENFISLTTLWVSGSARNAMDALLLETGLVFEQHTQLDGALSYYSAPLEDAWADVYFAAQETAHGTRLVWAQAYLAPAPEAALQAARRQAQDFVLNLYHTQTLTTVLQ